MSKRSRKKPAARREAPEPAPEMPIPDRRAFEKTMADVGRLLSEREFASIDEANAFLHDLMASGQPIAPPPSTPLEQAQDLMYEAWDAQGKRRVELARKALQISPDCADCYVLLAEETAQSLEEARDLYAQGVKAGERAIGPEGFEEHEGEFWGVVQTRPYMRARAGLAETLWLLGERKQAIAHLNDMLRLNPGDNQGLRYLLMGWLLDTGDDEALGELLRRYKGDHSAEYLYTNALWLYRRKGAGAEANKALKEALRENRHVPGYLLGRRGPPSQMPQYISPGQEDEAIAYTAGAIEAWRRIEGALSWLAQQVGPAKGHGRKV